MKPLRAIGVGAALWAVIFIEWSVMIFTPILKDLGNWQYAIHYVLLIGFVMVAMKTYYEKAKGNALSVGLVMLLTGIILDSAITIPLFTKPQGQGYAEFFSSVPLLIGFAEFLIIAALYPKLKKQAPTPAVNPENNEQKEEQA